jgi:hypothetical protein
MDATEGKTNGTTPAAPQQQTVQLQGLQLITAAALLTNGQIEAMLRVGAPPEAIIDMLVTSTAGLIARIEQPLSRQMLVDRIVGAFAQIVEMKVVEVRRTAGGVVLPHGMTPPRAQ